VGGYKILVQGGRDGLLGERQEDDAMGSGVLRRGRGQGFGWSLDAAAGTSWTSLATTMAGVFDEGTALDSTFFLARISLTGSTAVMEVLPKRKETSERKRRWKKMEGTNRFLWTQRVSWSKFH
jgi:hypothetical protein